MANYFVHQFPSRRVNIKDPIGFFLAPSWAVGLGG